MMKAPEFWYEDSFLSRILSPLSAVYRLGNAINQNRKEEAYNSNLPVLCVGNVSVGGSGKTPAVISIVKTLKEEGLVQNPVILTRGYGGSIKEATIVEPETHSFHEIGDEAFLLSQAAKTIICKNRAEGAKLAEKEGGDLIVMDDGLQNPTLHKDMSILMVDSKTGFGNQRLLPAGPLREPINDAFVKSDIIIISGQQELDFHFPQDKFVTRAVIKNSCVPDISRKYVAFAGLGYPEKFLITLKDLGLDIVHWKGFPDHHVYSRRHIQRLVDIAKKENAQLITTEKDYVRIPTAFLDQIITLPVDMYFEEKEKILDLLKDKLNLKT